LLKVQLFHPRQFNYEDLFFTFEKKYSKKIYRQFRGAYHETTCNNFFLKLNLIFTTTGSSGAQMGEVQARQTRQFTSNKLEFLFQLYLFFTSGGQFRSASGGSSGASNVSVHLKHARLFI
jgi:hypothetical protein